jgi:UDP-N-acetyl-D-galactosamine dehydrogenase
LGLTFKEDCPDLRNSKVPDVVRELQSFGVNVMVHDPLAVPEEAFHEYGITLHAWDELVQSEAVVIAVAHKDYLLGGSERIVALLKTGGCVVDVKSMFGRASFAPHPVWSL